MSSKSSLCALGRLAVSPLWLPPLPPPSAGRLKLLLLAIGSCACVGGTLRLQKTARKKLTTRQNDKLRAKMFETFFVSASLSE